MPAETDLRIDLLGPVEAHLNGERVALPGDRPTVVLAVLAISVGRAVGIDALAAAVWGERLPQRVRGSLQSLIMRLRRVLGASTITTGPAGYTLAIDSDRVDLWRFRRLAADASAVRADDPAKAHELFTQALRLWRGEPLAGLRIETPEADVSSALREERISTVQRRIDIDLAAGRSADVIAELQALTSRYPLRESLWRQLVTALDSIGEPAEAIEVYHKARVQLSEQLGIEPSRELQAIYQRLLVGERVHARFPAAAAGSEPRRQDPAPPVPAILGRPRQLPADADHFTGRKAELDALDALLPDADQPLVIVALDGPAGIGKTALAVHWAHRVRNRFPGGQLYLDLGGFGPDEPIDQADGALALLLSLGIAPAHIPGTLEERSAQLRSALAGRRAMIVLDDAADSEQVRPLLPGSGCLALVTSRNQLRGLTSRDGAHRLTLRQLPGDDAMALLVAGIGADRVANEPEAAAELVELCAGLPLALRVAVERIDRDRRVLISSLAGRLRDGLDALCDDRDPTSDVRAIFSRSRRALTPESDHLFRLLGLHPANRISGPAAAALAGDPDEVRVNAALDKLAAVHLLEQQRPGHYEFHDLLRRYATELADTELAPAERDAALRRVTDWYLQTADRADRAVRTVEKPPGAERDRRPDLPTLATRIPPLTFTDQAAATLWLTDNQVVLAALASLAAQRGWREHPCRLAAPFHRHGADLRGSCGQLEPSPAV